MAIFKCLIFLMLFSLFPASINSSSMLHKTPRLSPIGPRFPSSKTTFSSSLNSNSMKDFETKYYEQTLDHFNYQPQSYATFRQKYVINSKYWGGANSSSPIFAYLGAESALDDFTLTFIGTLTDNAPRFKALLVYLEHRFYGESIPFGLKEEEMLKNESIRGYFNSEQALADYAQILLHEKQSLCGPKSPIIVVGGSYGGTFASSAPILYFENIVPHDAYYSVVQKDFKEESESCFETIKKSWDIIYEVASKPNGLSFLSQKFNSCSELKSVEDLSVFIGAQYYSSAQYNETPKYPVKIICDAINNGSDDDVLGRISAGVDAINAYYGFKDECFDLRGIAATYYLSSWDWQTCSEMVLPIGSSDNITIVREKPFSMEERIKECKKYYGVSPRPYWATTYYGGHDIKMVLRKFGSNIIFSNGLRDPYSRGGILENLSYSLLAIHTTKGSHCLDMQIAKETDPKWLVNQRKKEVHIMQKWIANYYAHLSYLN